MPYTEINSKWIKGLHVSLDTIKLLEENIGRTPSDTKHSKIFLNPSLKVMKIKAKMNKWDLMELRSFYTAKVCVSPLKSEQSLVLKQDL